MEFRVELGKKNLVRSPGFGIVEVLIAAVILAGLVFGFNSLLINMGKGQQKIKLTGELDTYVHEIAIAMTSYDTCTFNLKAPNFSTLGFSTASLGSVQIPVTALEYSNGTPLATAGSSTRPSISVSTMRLYDFKELSPGTAYSAQLEIILQKLAPGAGGNVGSPVKREVNIGLTTIPGGGSNVTIVNCGVVTSVPVNAIMAFDAVNCPPGWVPVNEARGRTIVGTPAGGTLKAQVGTPLNNQENRAVGLHAHGLSGLPVSTNVIKNADPGGMAVSHIYLVPFPAATGDAGAAPGTNAPYVQFLYCKKL